MQIPGAPSLLFLFYLLLLLPWMVPAMIVHGAYDFIAIYLIAIEAKQQRQSRMAGKKEDAAEDE